MTAPTSPQKAIRAKCLDCVCHQQSLVKECEIKSCALWPFRMGKNPYRTPRQMTPEQREAAAARLSAARKLKVENDRPA